MHKFIAHRGNQNGPNPAMENNPEYIKLALDAGHDVEVDVWLLSDGLYLGHDTPTYKIERYFLQDQRVWTHCKTAETYVELSKFTDINCFFQTDEEIVATSKGYLWAHSKCSILNKNVAVTCLDSRHLDLPPVLAVCSDYVRNSINTLPFDLLIIDIDGVMTDGTKMYDLDGKVFGKKYCDVDFTAIKRFLAAKINVCFLSGDKKVNQAMAETRKIKFFHNLPGTNKVDWLPEIKRHYNYTAARIGYVGDDYYDLAIINAVDLPFCPKNAPAIIKRAATVIDAESGKGVIAKLYDQFENLIPNVYPMDSPDVNPL